MKCPKCQAANRNNAQFCRDCGQSLIRELTCAKCGYVNLRGSKFYDKCGQPFSGQSPDPAPTKPSSTAQPSPLPTSFANGRYTVKKFLGEGGKKKVYLAYRRFPVRAFPSHLFTQTLDEPALANNCRLYEPGNPSKVKEHMKC